MTYPNPKKLVIKKLILIFATTFLLNGCSFLTPYKAPVTQGTVVKASDIELLQPGLTKAQVQEIMGPDFGVDPFYPSHWEYVFYTTNKQFDAEVKHHVIVNFDKEGYLSNWQFPKSEVVIHEKGFFESLLE